MKKTKEKPMTDEERIVNSINTITTILQNVHSVEIPRKLQLNILSYALDLFKQLMNIKLSESNSEPQPPPEREVEMHFMLMIAGGKKDATLIGPPLEMYRFAVSRLQKLKIQLEQSN